MRIVIMGCGHLGSRLATALVAAGHEVVVVDQVAAALRALGDFPGRLIEGDARSPAVLAQALAPTPDVGIMVLTADHTSLFVAQVLRQGYHVPRVIVRVVDPILAGVYRELGLDTICPTDLSLVAVTERLKSTVT